MRDVKKKTKGYYHFKMLKGCIDVNKAVSNVAVDLTFWARSVGGVFRVQATIGMLGAGTSHFQHEYGPYPKYDQKTDLRMSAVASANNADVSAGFDLILLDN